MIFFLGNVLECSNYLLSALIHINAFMNASRYICTFAVQINFICSNLKGCVLQIRKCKGQEKRDWFLVTKVEFNFRIF